jgi:hypothetical protein
MLFNIALILTWPSTQSESFLTVPGFENFHLVSTYQISLLNGMGALGRVGANFLADMYGPFNVFVPCTIINAALIFAIFGV